MMFPDYDIPDTKMLIIRGKPSDEYVYLDYWDKNEVRIVKLTQEEYQIWSEKTTKDFLQNWK